MLCGGLIGGWSSGIGQVAQMTPHFSLQEFQRSAHSILHHLQIQAWEKEKMSQYSSHNINSFNTVNVSNNLTVTDDRSSILAWLSSLDPKSRHRDIQDRRVESIGEWLLQTEEFRCWHAGSGAGESDDAVLFCYGNPGVGKTYIR